MTRETQQNERSLCMTSYWKILTSFSFSFFKSNLEQSGSRNPEVLSLQLIFSLAVPFYLTKTEIRTKNLKHCSHTIRLSKGLTFSKKPWIFATKSWHQQNWRSRPTKRYNFWNFICVYLWIPKFNFLAWFQPVLDKVSDFISPPQNKPLKSQHWIGLNKKSDKMLKHFDISLILNMTWLLTWAINIALN